MNSLDVSLSISSANKEEIDWIKSSMDSYELKILPPENIRHINFVVYNDKSEKIGGILANTRYSTVYINTIWIDERYRKRGIGKTLIDKVEQEAIGMNCVYSALGSWESFNTRHFYESLGYVIVSTSNESPPGQTGYWFNKKLI